MKDKVLWKRKRQALAAKLVRLQDQRKKLSAEASKLADEIGVIHNEISDLDEKINK